MNKAFIGILIAVCILVKIMEVRLLIERRDLLQIFRKPFQLSFCEKEAEASVREKSLEPGFLKGSQRRLQRSGIQPAFPGLSAQ